MSRMYRGIVPSNLGNRGPTGGANFVNYRPDMSPYETLQGIFGAARGVAGAASQLSDISRQQARRQLLEDEQAKKSFAISMQDQINQVLIDNPDDPSGREEGLTRLAARYLDSPFQDVAFSMVGQKRAENANAYGREIEREAESARNAVRLSFQTNLLRAEPEGDPPLTASEWEDFYLDEFSEVLEGLGSDEERARYTLDIVRQASNRSALAARENEEAVNREQQSVRRGRVLNVFQGGFASGEPITDLLRSARSTGLMHSGGQSVSQVDNELDRIIYAAIGEHIADTDDPAEKIRRLVDLKNRTEQSQISEEDSSLKRFKATLLRGLDAKAESLAEDLVEDHALNLDAAPDIEQDAVREYMNSPEDYMDERFLGFEGEADTIVRAGIRKDMDRRTEAFRRAAGNSQEIYTKIATTPGEVTRGEMNEFFGLYSRDLHKAYRDGTPADVASIMSSQEMQVLSANVLPVPTAVENLVNSVEALDNPTPDDVTKAAILVNAYSGRVGSARLQFAAQAFGRPQSGPMVEVVMDRYNKFEQVSSASLSDGTTLKVADASVFPGYNDGASEHSFNKVALDPEFQLVYTTGLSNGLSGEEAMDFALTSLKESGVGVVYQDVMLGNGKFGQRAVLVEDSQGHLASFPYYVELMESRDNREMVVRKLNKDVPKGQRIYSPESLIDQGSFMLDPQSLVNNDGKSISVIIYTEANRPAMTTIDISDLKVVMPTDKARRPEVQMMRGSRNRGGFTHGPIFTHPMNSQPLVIGEVEVQGY